MSLTEESAGSQRSFTAKIITATVATRNSGTDTIDTAATLTARSNQEPRHIAEAIPSTNASGTETSAVAAASNSELGRRLPIIVATGRLLTRDWPGSPVTMPTSHCQ